jgi:hypothetical protein
MLSQKQNYLLWEEKALQYIPDYGNFLLEGT